MADHIDFERFRPHPWHGLAPGKAPPHLVQAYIEITPVDAVKYEIDKVTGYLRVDRPQRSSSQPPALYGFIPQTYCGPLVAALSPERLGHYFSTYKMVPGHPSIMVIQEVYGVAHAEQVVRAAIEDYIALYGQADRQDR
jgi:inorganic pyrophosphatase